MSEDWEDPDRPIAEGHEVGCLFPDECCMPYEHFTSECHTAEMMEQHAESAARVTTEFMPCDFCHHDQGNLCASCAHNRAVIEALQRTVDGLRDQLGTKTDKPHRSSAT